jgi:hypothetical protein
MHDQLYTQALDIMRACELVFPDYDDTKLALAIKRQVALHLAAQQPGAWMDVAGCHLPAVVGYSKRRAPHEPAKPS